MQGDSKFYAQILRDSKKYCSKQFFIIIMVTLLFFIQLKIWDISLKNEPRFLFITIVICSRLIFLCVNDITKNSRFWAVDLQTGDRKSPTELDWLISILDTWIYLQNTHNYEIFLQIKEPQIKWNWYR